MCQRYGLWEKLEGIPGLDVRTRTSVGFSSRAMVAQLLFCLTSGGSSLADAERNRAELWRHVSLQSVHYELAKSVMACLVGLCPWPYRIKGTPGVRFRIKRGGLVCVKSTMANGHDYTADAVYYQSEHCANVETPVCRGG
ncbi:MAG: hypothetical protein PHV34_12735 [Verrucomicrobiae bacterium]|nr:hypothetical protein [Verrucomicrobiae bacterium]